MNDPFFHLKSVEAEVRGMARQLARVRISRVVVRHGWQPALNAYRCSNRFVICVNLAGVDRESIRVQADPRRISVLGTRPPLEPGCRDPEPLQMLGMEIEHGPFERTIELPAPVDPEKVETEYTDGMLWIKVPLLSAS